MTVSLTKGGNVSLDKAATDAGLDPSSLTKVMLGLAWDPRSTSGASYDLDASAIICKDGKVLSDKHFVFYGNLASPDNAIVHSGDNLTGDGDGDDEQINVDLSLLDAAGADQVVFCVSIYEADKKSQNFGEVKNSYIRMVDATSGTELTKFDLQEDASSETVMNFGELYKKDGAWKFRAVGNGYANGLSGLAADFGVHVGA